MWEEWDAGIKKSKANFLEWKERVIVGKRKTREGTWGNKKIRDNRTYTIERERESTTQEKKSHILN